ncbi:uncharacterized protein RCO7_02735 [Rhynchosporium graminicola]|uniref:Uncharacterized protein n=1 Tax=Rhynchosporium graminicola TaxID=2792576 RepID=A0A1E1KG87_9HELO|nr:uncharacterized protein RCO7_02735 [Rhynchosporium commune]
MALEQLVEKISRGTTEKPRAWEDAVWLDPDYCESFALGGSNAAVTSEDKHGEGKDKGKGKDKVSEMAEDSLSSDGGSSGWQWDNEMQMNKRWANDLEAYVYWDESARAETYWDGTDWKWVK